MCLLHQLLTHVASCSLLENADSMVQSADTWLCEWLCNPTTCWVIDRAVRLFKVRENRMCRVCRQLGMKTATKQSMECSTQSHSLEQCDVAYLEEAMPLCEQVHEQHGVQGVGNFTAFQDGSVHVAFEDRALLYMQPGCAHCNVINPEGQKVSVATANPLGVEQYVVEAVEFAAWAFSSPAQRSAVLQQAASIQQELDKCQRSALLCDWAQGHSVAVHQKVAELTDEIDSAIGHSVLHGHDISCSVSHSFESVHDQIDTAARQHVINSFLANNSRLVSTL